MSDASGVLVEARQELGSESLADCRPTLQSFSSGPFDSTIAFSTSSSVGGHLGMKQIAINSMSLETMSFEPGTTVHPRGGDRFNGTDALRRFPAQLICP